MSFRDLNKSNNLQILYKMANWILLLDTYYDNKIVNYIFMLTIYPTFVTINYVGYPYIFFVIFPYH